MEEVYIIKLKGLPVLDNEAYPGPKSGHSQVYTRDISPEALLGFGLFHLMLGALAMILGAVSALTDWKLASVGLGCGLIFMMTGLLGVWASNNRKSDFTRSKPLLQAFLVWSILSKVTSVVFVALTLTGVSCNYETSQRIVCNIIITLVIEFVVALLSSFTAARTLWPTSLLCCAKNWPTRPKLKRKVIVATSIFARGVYSAQDFTRYLSPNCVVSLAAPKQVPVIPEPDQSEPIQPQDEDEDSSSTVNSVSSSTSIQPSESNKNYGTISPQKPIVPKADCHEISSSEPNEQLQRDQVSE